MDTISLIFESKKKLVIQSIETRKKQKMLYFELKKRLMKEEEGNASMENSKGYWNGRYCYISESRRENILKSVLATVERNSHINVSLKQV